MMRIVEFSTGQFAVRTGVWPFYRYLDADGSNRSWSDPDCVLKWSMLNKFEDAQKLISLHAKKRIPPIKRVTKP